MTAPGGLPILTFSALAFPDHGVFDHDYDVPYATVHAGVILISGSGYIAQAHHPNEWVTLDQLAQREAFMRRLADRVCVA